MLFFLSKAKNGRVKNIAYNRRRDTISQNLHDFIFFGETMRERDFQKDLMREIEESFPGCVVAKTDPTYIQGFPDLLILHNDKWATLECKRSAKASLRPNQDVWVERLGEMSFASFIFPENRKDVLNALQKYFEKS